MIFHVSLEHVLATDFNPFELDVLASDVVGLLFLPLARLVDVFYLLLTLLVFEEDAFLEMKPE